MAKVGDNIAAGNANWSFGGRVANIFDEHISKSVPFYHQGHDLVIKLSDFFLSNDSLAYDIGCSTGMLLVLLAERNRQQRVQFVGIEFEQSMVEQARARAAPFDNITIEQADFFDVALEKADLITSYYTIQFVQAAAPPGFLRQGFRVAELGRRVCVLREGPRARRALSGHDLPALHGLQARCRV